MSQWLRVFGSNDSHVEPVLLLQHLQEWGGQPQVQFRGDDQGWFEADVQITPSGPALSVQRYLASEEGIRAELNTWAAWLETVEGNSHALPLMQRVIGARQLFTLQILSDFDAQKVDWCIEICRFLARQTDGVYQVDGKGFFAANGTLLVPENDG